MTSANRRLHPATFAGLVSLGLASIVRLVVSHYPPANDNVSDFIIGLLYGVAIAAMLIGIRTKARENAGRPLD